MENIDEYVQALKDPKRPQTKVRSENRKETIEEGHRPGHLGEKEEDDLEDDE